MKVPRKKQPSGPSVCVPVDFFVSLDELQLRILKEMFSFIDQDKDGRITDGDLKCVLATLGQPVPAPGEIRDMLEGNANLNFGNFLSMFGNRTARNDSEKVIREAFRCLDETGLGKLDANCLKDLLSTGEDRLTDDEVKQLFEDIPVDHQGMLDYDKVTQMLIEGPEDQKADPKLVANS